MLAFWGNNALKGADCTNLSKWDTLIEQSVILI